MRNSRWLERNRVLMLGFLLACAACRATPTLTLTPLPPPPAVATATPTPVLATPSTAPPPTTASAAATATSTPGPSPTAPHDEAAQSRCPPPVPLERIGWNAMLPPSRTYGMGEILDIGVSADGRFLAVAGGAGLYVYRLDPFEWVRTLGARAPRLERVALSPDGALLAAGYNNGTVGLWDVASGKLLHLLDGGDLPVLDVFFSPDGATLISVVHEHPPVVWDVQTGAPLRALTSKRQSRHTSAALSPDGLLLAVGTYEGVKLMDVSAQTKVRLLDESPTRIESLAFTPDGTTLAVGTSQGQVYLYGLATEQARVLDAPRSTWVDLHDEWKDVEGLVFSPDGTRLAVVSADKAPLLIDVASDAVERTLAPDVEFARGLAFTPDGQTLVAASRDNIFFWDADTGALTRALGGHSGWLLDVSFAPDGVTPVSVAGNLSMDLGQGRVYGTGDATFVVWDTETGLERRVLADPDVRAISAAIGGPLSPDAGTLAFGSADGAVRLWDAAAGKLLCTLEGHADAVYSVAFAPDGSLLASGAADGTVLLWNLASCQPLRALEGHPGQVSGLAFSPDGATLAVSASQVDAVDRAVAVVALWPIQTDKPPAMLHTPLRYVNEVAFSPDGLTLAAASAGDGLALWDLTAGTCHAHVDVGGVDGLAFSPDSRLLALAQGGIVTVLDTANAASGGAAYGLKGNAGHHSIAFAPDGITLAAGTHDGALNLWRLDAVAPAPAASPTPVRAPSTPTRAPTATPTPPLPTPAPALGRLDVAEERCWPHRDVPLPPDCLPHPADRWLGFGRVWDVDVSPSGVLSPDGELVALAASTGVYLLRLDTLEQVRELGDYTLSEAARVAFSPDGTTLAAGYRDGTVMLLNVATGETMHTWYASTERIRDLAFSPDGTLLATVAYDGPIYLWSVATGERVHALTRSGKTDFRALAFSPDGRFLADARSNDTRLWDVTTGYQVRLLGVHDHAISSLAFSPDGSVLAQGTFRGHVVLVDPESGEILHAPNFEGSAYGVAFSPDGDTLVAAVTRVGLVYLDVATGEPTRTLELDFLTERGLASLILSPDVAFTPDGRRLVLSSDQGYVMVLDAATGEPLREYSGHTGPVLNVSWTPDGARLISAAGGAVLQEGAARDWWRGDASVLSWDVATGRRLSKQTDPNETAICAAYTPDGGRLAQGTLDGLVLVWNVAAGEPLHVLEGHGGAVYGVAYSPDGTTLASASVDGSVILWDAATGHRLRTLDGHHSWVLSVAFAPDGATLAAGTSEYTVALWDVESGRRLRNLRTATKDVMRLAYRPDGRLLAAASTYGRVTAWETDDWRRVREFDTVRVGSLAFSPDGTWLAVGGSRQVLLLELVAGKQFAVLVGPSRSGTYSSLAFSPDGATLAAGVGDGSLVLWQIDEAIHGE